MAHLRRVAARRTQACKCRNCRLSPRESWPDPLFIRGKSSPRNLPRLRSRRPSWRDNCACRQTASPRSCTASARSPATRRCGSAIGSAPARSSGSICKAPMTFASRKDRQVRRSGGCRNEHTGGAPYLRGALEIDVYQEMLLLPSFPASRGRIVKSSDYIPRPPCGCAAQHRARRTSRACALRRPGFRPRRPAPVCWKRRGRGPRCRPRPSPARR